MKRVYIYMFAFVALGVSSCKKFLDVNKNVNQATTSTPQLILPQAIVATASQVNGYNSMGAQFVGYMANAGGYGGFGTSVTYDFSSNDFTGRWGIYDNLEDYQQIIETTTGKSELIYFNSIARIMKAHDFQKLVDTYNSVPYTTALGGQKDLTPQYDDPAAIYADLVVELDKAVDSITVGQDAAVAPTPVKPAQDPMFGGDMDLWKKFANTLKLRIIIRGNGKVNFAKKTFSSDGFLTEDAMVNPGYTRDNGKQNPKWESWGFGATGSDANKAWMPNTFVFAFYNGTKLTDDGRGSALYFHYPTTGKNRLGVESTSVPSSPSGSFWLPSDNRDGKSAGEATGVLKGPDASLPIITAAESYFLQAEGVVSGLISGDAADLFNKGIASSFTYLYSLPDGTVSGDPDTDVEDYFTNNSASRLVNFSLATTTAQKIEAIITQKYIALNMVNSDEAWNDYRRTHYPTINNAAGATGTETFASTQSKSTRPDHLPTRILYPTSEGAYNSANVPKGISPFSSLIFWALQ